VRVDRLTESVSIVKRLLAGDTVDHAGEHYTVTGATGFPALDHHVPLMIGGNGDRVLRLAAREADIVGFVGFRQVEGTRDTEGTHMTWDGLADRIATARTGAPDRFDALERNVLVQAVVTGTDPRAAARQVAYADEVGLDLVLDSPFLMLGTRRDRVEHVRRLRDEHGIGYVTVFEPYMDAAAEVIGDL
jgi:alkanesulfonate monooxygenase SsuD/methylene tetrahydromethanopterin reductase-like flavin-dependent oxidoreductase (luciferase family)